MATKWPWQRDVCLITMSKEGVVYDPAEVYWYGIKGRERGRGREGRWIGCRSHLRIVRNKMTSLACSTLIYDT